MFSLMNLFNKPQYSTIDELEKIIGRSEVMKAQSDMRSTVKIAVIDDNRFTPMKNLENLGFDITELGDIKRIEEIEKYSIVLCDLMGVGLAFDKHAQGAQVISEIKLNFPTIFVIAYTAASLNSKEVKLAKPIADNFIRKDAHIHEWKELLDPLVAKSIDPREVWLRFRTHLVEKKINTLLLLKLEDAYVKSFKKKDPAFRLMIEVVEQENDSGKWKSLIIDMAASAIFKALMSSL